MKGWAIVLCLCAGAVQANEAHCLGEILYAEARGESIEGVAAVGQAAIKKARIEHTTVCRVKGVTRLTPSQNLLEYYTSMASHLLEHPKETVSKGASHWERGTKPHLPGIVRRHIGKHIFYELRGTQ
jgi:hypothetical protein